MNKELYFKTFDIAYEWMLSDGGDGTAIIQSQFGTMEDLKKVFKEWYDSRDDVGENLVASSDLMSYCSKRNDESMILWAQREGQAVSGVNYVFSIY